MPVRFPIFLTLVVALGLCAVASIAGADVISWANAADGLWSVGANWTGGIAPGPLDDAVITVTGASSYTVTLDTSPTVNSLTLGATSGVTTQTLSSSGRTITLATPATINEKGVLRLLSTTTIAGAVSNSGSIVVSGVGNSISGAYTSVSGSVLRVDCVDTNNLAALTIANGFTNNGSIDLTATTFAYESRLTVTSGTLVNASGGMITSAIGVGGGRVLEAQLDNQGQVQANWPLTLNKPDADHLNSGGIVTGVSGGFTVSQTGTTPSFTNQTGANYTIAGGTLFLVQGGAFNHDPVSHSGAGAVAVTNCNVFGVTLGAGSAVFSLRGGNTVDAITSAGTVVVHGTANAVTGYTSLSGSTLRMDCTVLNDNAALTITNGFTNNGSIDLTATTYAYESRLTVTNGTLVNASGGGVISSSIGVGGLRVLEAQLDNQGQVQANWPLALNKPGADHLNSGGVVTGVSGGFTVSQTGATPSFTNLSGANYTIAGGTLFLITGGTFNHDPVAHTGPGTLAVSNCNVIGVTLASTSAVFSLRANNTVDAITSAGTVVAHGTANVVTGYTSLAGSTLRVDCAVVNDNAAITVTNGFTNNGLIDLTASTYAYESRLTVTNGTLVNASGGGVISSSIGVGGTRVLAAQLDNQGQVQANWPLTLNKPDADHLNSGGIVTGVSGGFTVSQTGATPSFTNQTGANYTIAGGTLFLITGGAFNHDPVAHTGPGTLAVSNCNVVGVTLASTSAVFSLRGSNTVDAINSSGTVVGHGPSNVVTSYTSNSGSTLRVDCAVVNDNAAITVTNGFTNNGLIDLTANTYAYESRLTVTNGTLVNASGGGVISSSIGVGGTRVLAAQLDNQGQINANWLLTLDKADADHLNSGGIALGLSGGFTVNQTGATPSFTNQTGASYAIPTDRLFLITGGAFNHDPVTHTGPGTLAVSNCNVVGVTLASTSAVFSLRGSNTVDAINSSGTVVGHGLSNVVTSYTSSSGSTLRVDCAVVNDNAAITVTNGFTNNGLIDLTASTYAYESRLTVTNGTLVNASGGGVISSSIGVGGTRVLAAQLDNQGQINANWLLTLDKAGAGHLNSGGIALGLSGGFTVNQTGTTPSFTNQTGANYTIPTDRVFTINGGTFNHDPVAHTGPGTLAVSNCNVVGVTLASTSAVFSLRGSNTVDAINSSGTVVGHGPSNVVTSYTSNSGSTLRVDCAVVNDNAAITVTNGFTNNGLIDLTANTYAYESRLTVTNGTLVNASGGGVISSSIGVGGTRVLAAQLDNQGQINANWLLTLDKADAGHLNSGGIALGLSGGFTVNQTGTTPSFTNQTGATYAIPTDRLFLITGGTFNHDPVTHTGPGTLAVSDCNVVGVTLASTSAVFSLRANNTVDAITNGGKVFAHGLLNNVSSYTSLAGSTLRVDCAVVNANAAITIANGFTNNGLIDLTANTYAYESRLAITTGTLVNAGGGGVITSSIGVGGTRTIAAQLHNHGQLEANWQVTLDKPGADHLNGGTMTLGISGGMHVSQTGPAPSFGNLSGGTFVIPTDRLLLITGGTFNHDPGTHSGTGTLAVSNCTVVGVTLVPTSAVFSLRSNTTVDAITNGGTVVAHGSSNQVGSYGSLGGSTLRVDCAAVNDNAQLTIASGFTNRGLIDLTANTYAYQARLLISADTLVNAPAAVIRSTIGVGGTRVLAAPVENHGLMDVNWPLQMQTGPLVNFPDGTVRGTGTLDVTLVTYSDQGTTSPGVSPGILTIHPDDQRQPTSALNIEIGGLSSGTQYDRLHVNNTVTLGGALNLQTSYTPTLGDSITIVTAGSVVDTFDLVSGRIAPGGLEWQVKYRAQRVDLIAGTPPPDNAPTANVDVVTTPEDQYLDIAVRANDTDPDGDSVYVVAGSFSSPLHGSIGLNFDQTVRYQPHPNYVGADQFVYLLTDNRGGQDTAIVHIDVTPANDAPHFTTPIPPDTAVYARGHQQLMQFRVTAADVDLGDVVTLTGTSLPAGATLTPVLPTNGNPATSLFQWTPSFSQIGDHYVRFIATDLALATDTVVVKLQVYDNPTPVLLVSFDANPEEHGIALRWRVTASPGSEPVALERADRAEGPWTPLALEQRDEDGTTVALDPTAQAGRSYHYRLTTRLDGTLVVLGTLESHAGGTFEFVLAPVSPSPSRGLARVTYALAHEARVRLTLSDIQGREVATLAEGVLSAGRHQALWNGTIAGARAPAGVYFVRLEAAGQRFVTRLVLAH